MLTDDHVAGLAEGDPETLTAVMRFAYSIVTREARQKRIQPFDIEDIVGDALAESFALIREGKVSDGNQLTQAVKRFVWRYSQRIHRKALHETRTHINFDELVGRESVPSVSPGRIDDVRAEKIYQDKRVQEQHSQTQADLLVIDNELIKYFRSHPEKMYELNPRKFEELVALFLADMGYSIELTAEGADGGVDIFATQKTGIGEVLLIVDCKRYAPSNHVGVGIVRSLYGLGEMHRATKSMLATTSFFTRQAIEFEKEVRHRLSLRDYNSLIEWIDGYGLRT